MARPKHLKRNNLPNLDTDFPKIRKANHLITSDDDPRYNCIAWAAGITNRKYWPEGQYYYWPKDVPRAVTLDSFKALYATFGYAECPDGSYEEDFEKIAIYASNNGFPTHAARLIGKNEWSSKLGDRYDISHERDALTGGAYGNIKVFMRRIIRGDAQAA